MMGLERTALPTSWGRIGPECLDLSVVPSIYSSASSWVSEVSPAARNTLDFARIPRASKLLICGLFQKGRVLAQDGVGLQELKFLEEGTVAFARILKHLFIRNNF